MKNLHWLLILTLLFTSCDKDSVDPEQELSNGISFAIERKKSDNDYSTSSKQASLSQVESGWQLMMDGKIQLSRAFTYDVELKNGETLTMRINLYKLETNPDILILEDEEAAPWTRRWKYTSADLEAENFYRGFDGGGVQINSTHVVYNDADSYTFNVEVEKAKSNGKEQNIVKINFAGTAYGWYDPRGEYMDSYRVKNGKFASAIE